MAEFEQFSREDEDLVRDIRNAYEKIKRISVEAVVHELFRKHGCVERIKKRAKFTIKNDTEYKGYAHFATSINDWGAFSVVRISGEGKPENNRN